MRNSFSARLGILFFFLYWISGLCPVFASSNDTGKGILFCSLGLIGGVFAFFWGFSELRTKRLMQNIPVSTIRAMAPGMVEITGQAVNWQPLQGPLTQETCVYFQYLVEQLVSSGKSSHWETILSGDSKKMPFFIQDETGTAMVISEGSSVVIPDDYHLETGLFSDVPQHVLDFVEDQGVSCKTFFGFDKKLRFTERNLKPGEKVFAMGTCQEAAILPPSPPAGTSSTACVARGERSGDIFLLSDESQQQLVSSYGWHAFFGIFGGLALIGGCLYGLLTLLGMT
jgi:hypothetical protein